MNNQPSTNHQLNLARKWRPKSFDQVVGQDIAVRMIKNSLFLNKFFPVYLFAGQRGCGKTSTARVFAAAVNCESLPSFQKNPTAFSIPCLQCASCISMTQGDHPDFIEIDAASHTGVDNVRQIIESSSYMPLVGRKKIYLIDEAHMLSKAAFNAFLKILEEPPASVIFILATTEVPKIPATVLSRCFQLIFNPINNESLKAHLRQICTDEQVVIDDAALDLLLAETEGSARDAINLLERVRFSSDHVTEQVVLHVLGKMSAQELFELFDHIIAQKADLLLAHLQKISFEQRSPTLLWDMIVHTCRHLVWIKYGVQNLPASALCHLAELKRLADACSLNRLNSILNLLWSQEEIFLKTHKKHLFLEMVLLQLCQQVNVTDIEDLIKACKALPSTPVAYREPPLPPSTPSASPPSFNQETPQETPEALTPIAKQLEQPMPQRISQDPAWAIFLNGVSGLQDLLLNSIVRQAVFVKKDDATQSVVIQLSAESAFFKNKIEEAKALWTPLLAEAFSGIRSITYAPSPRLPLGAGLNPVKQPTPTPPPQSRPPLGPQPAPSRSFGNQAEFLTIKNPDQWPRASLILRYFSGKIKKIKSSQENLST